MVAASSMVLIHKFFKTHSLNSISSKLLLASSCVFLVAKVLYVPVSLGKIVQEFFNLEKRHIQGATGHAPASLSRERELTYRVLIENME